MKSGKGMKYVGDSRVVDKPKEQRDTTPKDYSEYPGKTEAFWPNFLLKEWMVGAVFLVGFLALIAAHPAPLERIADPTDTGYIPLPDWYFLFLYQLLKFTYASGPYNVIGTMVIPGLAFTALLLAPFLDRGLERRPSKRPIAVSFMLLAIAAIFYLTWDAAAHHDWEKAKEQGKIAQEIDTKTPGYVIAAASTCTSCHGEKLQGGPAAPKLVGTGHSPEEVTKIARDGTGKMPAGIYKGSDEDLTVLAKYIAELK